MLSLGLLLVTYHCNRGVPSTPSSALPMEGEVVSQLVLMCWSQLPHEGPCHGTCIPLPGETGVGEKGEPQFSTTQATHIRPGPQCDLQGLWRSELGSNMTISAMNAAGTFSGSYHTAMAATNKQILVSPLQGIQQHPNAKRHRMFSFTVQWQFSGTAVTVIPCPCWEWGSPCLVPQIPYGTQGNPDSGHRLATHTHIPAMGSGGRRAVCLWWVSELSGRGGASVHPSIQRA